MLKGLIGKKIGMTQIFDEKGVAFPVTIIEAGPCYVTQVRTLEKEDMLQSNLGLVNFTRRSYLQVNWDISAQKVFHL